jgi:hypothetical protein
MRSRRRKAAWEPPVPALEMHGPRGSNPRWSSVSSSISQGIKAKATAPTAVPIAAPISTGCPPPDPFDGDPAA